MTYSIESLSSKNIRAARQWAASFLTEHGVTDAQLDADLLLASSLGISRVQLFLEIERVLSQAEWQEFARSVRRRSEREPLQYILGEQDFMGLTFQVTPAVLVPRPETERLVELAVAWLKNKPGSTALDLCTGSGAIAVCLAKLVPGTTVWASDISPAALEVARGNAQKHQVAVRFRQGDLAEPFRDMTFNLITANPPYIPSALIAQLEPEVSQAEPRQALDGGNDGLVFYRRLAKELPMLLRPGGKILLEIGWDQGETVQDLFRTAGFSSVEVMKDYGDRDRILTATIGG
ncbi:MAG TPA: peptide chain release factor N(5)-glutamine methyltransferase [Desulfobacteria bacterium]|nr:peptide chain release factor N(5)-glutamine methyltransferase [Desulfobacteria bacterium]